MKDYSSIIYWYVVFCLHTIPTNSPPDNEAIFDGGIAISGSFMRWQDFVCEEVLPGLFEKEMPETTDCYYEEEIPP